MNLVRLFETKNEIEEARNHFLALKENDDWKFLVEKVISAYIKEITEKLLNPETIWKNSGEEQEARRIRQHWIILSELPEELLKTLIENKNDKGDEDNGDPYPKTAKDLQEL